jgi:protein TonB
MNTMSMSAGSEAVAGLSTQFLAGLKAKRRKFGPLASIIALHVLGFYLVQSGMLRTIAHAALPTVITVSFVAPPAPPKPSTPELPKTVQVAPKIPTFIPPLPLLATPQIEPTITVPVKAAEVAPAVAAAPSPPAPAPVPVVSAPRMVTGVEYIKAPQPVYPSISRRLGETGVVILRILIGVKGQPEQVIVQKSSGSTNLDEAGREAAKHALFKPYMEDGKPVSVFVLVPLNFQMG